MTSAAPPIGSPKGLADDPPAIQGPAVTVLVQCYNHARYVEQALGSILDQTYPNLQIVVVDDASQDGTADVIESVLAGQDDRVRFIRHVTNRGQCPTLNEVLAQVDTPYLSVVSGDDWSEPDRVAVSVRELERLGPTYGAVYGDAFLSDEDGTRAEHTAHRGEEMPTGEVLAAFLSRNPVLATNVMMRVEAVRAVGGYDEAMPVEDYDLWLRLAADFRFGYIALPLATHRLVNGSLYDRVGPAYFHWSRLHSMPKHLGRGSETDAIILDRLWNYARWLYLAGEDVVSLRPTFRLLLHQRPGARTALWYLAARLRLPARAIRDAAAVLGRRGNIHRFNSRWDDES